MRETMIAVSVVALILLCSLAGVWIRPRTLWFGGAWLISGGLFLGTPAGILYHVLLLRVLTKSGRVPNDWWLRPTRYNHVLFDIDSPWLGIVSFYLGAMGAGVAFLGCVTWLLALLGMRATS